MAEAFGIGAGIVGVIGLAIQITQVVVQFGLDWKDAPHDIKTFLAELQTLNTILSVTNTNIILNPDFAEAFQNRPSILLSQLGPGAPPATDTKLMLEICKSELEDLLSELKKRAKGHRVGWERVKGAFLAKNTRESVGNLHRQCQTLNNMVSIDAAVLGATTYKEVKEARTEQQEARKEQQEWYQSEASQMILTWLTTIDYGAQQSDFLSRRQEGTGRWLLDSHEFQTWSNEYRQALFCSGMPGTGKTIMVSIVADYLCTKYRNDNNIGIAYLYCSFRRQHEQRPVDLLASLLKQFIRGLPVMPESMKNLYKRHMGKQTRPSLDEISKELHSVVADYSKSFIIIDALDECQVSDGGRQKFLSELLNLQAKAGASLFATSRFIPEITKEFVGKSVSLEIRASEEDVRRYLDGHMAQLPSFVLSRPDLREEIKTEIVKAVDGMCVTSYVIIFKETN
jgi:Cdc6-like AAA superfamily ATPase